MIDISTLWEHQKQTYNFGKEKLALVDGSDPGTGKTLAHAKIAEYFLSTNGSRVVIACPKTLIHCAWSEELTHFCPEISFSIAEAPAANREAAFKEKTDIVIINIDGIKWIAEQNPQWLKNRIGDKALLIIDESHTLKNPSALRTKAAFKIAPLFYKRHIASGTMAPNTIIELWSQLKIIDDGLRLGKRFTSFRNLFQIPVHRGPFIEWVDKPDASEIVYGLIADIIIRHKFESVMKDVPDMEQHIVYYDLPRKHRKLYEVLERQSYLEHAGKTISAVNASTLAGKLLQCASGAAYNDFDGRNRSWSIIDSGRYQLIADLVEARPHSIVFFLWHHQKEELAKALNARQLSFAIMDGTITSSTKRQEIVQNMQAGNLRCLLLHPETGAYGLTLTKATSAIYASPVYEAKQKIQGDARIRRGIQDKVTESIVVLAKNTRDIHAYEVFSGKRNRLEALNQLFEQQTLTNIGIS